MNDDSALDRLFQEYRAACPEMEQSADFLASVWQKIEARQNFWYVFRHLGRPVAAASAAVCILMLVLNLISSPGNPRLIPSYTDALIADHTAEKTYYAEAIRNIPAGGPSSSQPAH